MNGKTERLKLARTHLDNALNELESMHRVWTESVTSLHMAELNLRKAQKHTRLCWSAVTDILNGEG